MGESVDEEAFWAVGPLPRPVGEPVPDPAGPAPDRLGRPDVTVDGRNLADVLRGVYRAITAD